MAILSWSLIQTHLSNLTRSSRPFRMFMSLFISAWVTQGIRGSFVLAWVISGEWMKPWVISSFAWIIQVMFQEGPIILLLVFDGFIKCCSSRGQTWHFIEVPCNHSAHMPRWGTDTVRYWLMTNHVHCRWWYMMIRYEVNILNYGLSLSLNWYPIVCYWCCRRSGCSSCSSFCLSSSSLVMSLFFGATAVLLVSTIPSCDRPQGLRQSLGAARSSLATSDTWSLQMPTGLVGQNFMKDVQQICGIPQGSVSML